MRNHLARRRGLQLLAAALVALPAAVRAADLPPALQGRWQIDRQSWTSSFGQMAEAMIAALPADQQDEMRMTVGSQEEQLADPAGGLARIVSFGPDGDVMVEGGDDSVVPEGMHWTLEGRKLTLATDDPTDLPFAGQVEGDAIDLRPVLDQDALEQSPWSAKLHLVLRRIH